MSRFAISKARAENKAGQTEEGIPIYETESVNGLVGILRPAILISTEVRKNERQKEFVIRHELEHLRAKDNFWILIKNLCLMLQWYNPFVWIAYLKAAEDCELACDARVAKGLAPEGRESYAAFLLETASHGRRSLAVASTMSGDGKSLKKRITSMFMKQKGKRFWWLVLLLAGITLAVVLRVALVPGDREARGETKTQEQTSPPSETAEPSASPVVANSITTPWDYPIQPGSEEWLAMDVAEAMAMLDVPADIVDAMTTQALLETVINYPMISNIYMYGDMHFGISATKNAFYALDALLEREDAKNILEGSLADVRKRMPSLEGEEERLAATERETLLKALLQYVTGDYPSSEKLEKEKEYQY